MRQPRIRGLATLVGVLATLVVAPGEVGAAAPTQQPWGPAPANVASYRNGTVLHAKPVNASIFGIPLPAKAWQVQYKSIDNHGAPNVYVATILVPTAAWHGSGPRPLVSYQFAEDGLAYKCAPSYELTAGLAGFSLSAGEPPGIMTLALLRGWALVVPDYEGPDSEFLGAAGSAHGVLDGIRAAKNFTTAGISRSAPVGIWGYSGGALASVWAAMSQPRYAPELTIAGVALGGTPASLTASALAFDKLPLESAALNVLFDGLDRSYPQRHLLGYLNPSGRAAVTRSESDCLIDPVVTSPLAHLKTYGVTVAELNAMTKGVSPLDYPGIPAEPVLMYHSVLDELAPVTQMRKLAAKFCDEGVAVTKVESLLGEHTLWAPLGAPTAVQYLADRFAGKPARRTC